MAKRKQSVEQNEQEQKKEIENLSYTIDATLKKEFGEEKLKEFDEQFIAAAEQFPTEEVSIISFAQTKEKFVVVLHAETQGVRKITLPL